MAEIEVPPYFLCPITLDIMEDPVTISTGITYDRGSIEKWLFSQKNNTCPVTKQSLSDNDLIPNITLRRLIQSWCTLHASNGVERLPTPKAPINKPQLLKLLNNAKSPQMQMVCLQQLRSIASHNQTNRRCMENVGVAEFLAWLIVENTLQAHELSEDNSFECRKTCDEALSILHNLQLSESGLKALINGEFLESLTRIMQCGSYESRTYSIMLLKSILEVADPARVINLRPEFFVELVQILDDQICQKGLKATLKVLITVSQWGRNRFKAVEAGAVPVLIDLLLDSSSDKRACEMILVVLDLLCQCAEGRADLLQHGAGLAIVAKKILRVSPVASERAVRILHSICKFSATAAVLQEMLQIGVVAKLCLVLQVDCGLKTRERSREMLKLHSRAWSNSSCIPKNFVSLYPSN
ncbi:hypothetical protein BUALT_Bualt09G0102100 [Buddleja alternifolia]|uniref:U-box domain-containing protein n=1 Tax=Buddleja alternifolia TaxID=168488 RepID=A0AAV6X5S3_9LAMI|nr:hypothetical protein BUALT_Bualt09G0102100 [Buddleja alternifolia]